MTGWVRAPLAWRGEPAPAPAGLVRVLTLVPVLSSAVVLSLVVPVPVPVPVPVLVLVLVLMRAHSGAWCVRCLWQCGSAAGATWCRSQRCVWVNGTMCVCSQLPVRPRHYTAYAYMTTAQDHACSYIPG